MSDNMQDLLSSADISDGVTDIEFKVSGRLFAAHKYILAARSRYFANLFIKKHDNLIELKGYNPAVFEELLMYIYTGRSELTEVGDLKTESLIQLCSKNVKENLVISENEEYKDKSAFEYYSEKKSAINQSNDRKLDNPVRMLHEMAKRFEIIELQKILSNLDMHKSTVRVKKGGQEVRKSPVVFSKSDCPELYDVEILCKDDRVLKGHKCILYARLDYFGSMFSSRWGGVSDLLCAFYYIGSLLCDKIPQKNYKSLNTWKNHQ